MSYLREHEAHIEIFGGWTAGIACLSSELGAILIESCDVCPEIQVQCLHLYTHPDGSCKLCGDEDVDAEHEDRYPRPSEAAEHPVSTSDAGKGHG